MVEWEPEVQLAAWVGASVVLMTGSLLFYHMTNGKNPSLYVTPYVSAGLCIGLIIVDVVISIFAVIEYDRRSKKILENSPNEDENLARIKYTILIGALIVLQFIICIYIIRDSIVRVKHRKKHSKSKLYFA